MSAVDVDYLKLTHTDLRSRYISSACAPSSRPEDTETMKSTSARYLLPLFLSVGLPIACSGSTDKVTKPADGKEYSEAGAAGSDGRP